MNLYGFVGNDGVDRADSLGLAFIGLGFVTDDENLDPSAEKEIYPSGPKRKNPRNSLGTVVIKYDITAKCRCRDEDRTTKYYILESLYVMVYSHISLPKSFREGVAQREWAMDNELDHTAAIEKVFGERLKEMEKTLDALEKKLQRDIPNAKTRFKTNEECEDGARKSVADALSGFAALAAAESQDVDKFLKRKHNWEDYKEDLERERRKKEAEAK